MNYHPNTGVHYAHVIPGAWGAHVDVHATWSKLARIYPWISVHEPSSVFGASDEKFPLWNDKNALIVVWGGVPKVRKQENRKARTALVYSEAIGAQQNMLPEHLKEIERLDKAIAEKQYDVVLGHTPWMVGELEKHDCKSFLLPLGYDEGVYGSPRFEGPKLYDYVYYGSNVGKRLLAIPFLKNQLGERIHDISGCFGRLVSSELDRSRANLYIAHSDVQSYSTWRIWQTLGSSAAIVGEPGDSWPLDPARHMVTLETIDWVNACDVPERLMKILQEIDLLGIARLAYEEVAKKYTCEYCLREFLVPVGASLCGR
ncbi:MAG: hypothetical protein PHC68_04115 [Syntrophorhabdaceae bacterium]|nr:hypothetical protein [Syntrophorhabdaceae bacterium]